MDDDPVAVQLLAGRWVRIRPISPADGDALVHFHEGLTKETTRLRFFPVHPYLSPTEVERFTHVDHHDREALVALDGPELIAVGRFDRLRGTDDAEVAFVVAGDWQGHGIGTHLLAQLVRRARAEGITQFVADTLGENYRMRDVFRHSGLMAGSRIEAGVVHDVLDLGTDLAGPPPWSRMTSSFSRGDPGPGGARTGGRRRRPLRFGGSFQAWPAGWTRSS